MTTQDDPIQAALTLHKADPESGRLALIEYCCDRIVPQVRRTLHGDFARMRALEETEDVAQEVRMRLWRDLRAFEPESAGAFWAFAATTMRRQLIDLARHHFGPNGLGTRQRPLVGDSAADASSPDLPPNSTYDPEKLAIWTEFHERVTALPDAHREVFERHWYLEMTPPRIAEDMGIPVGSVRRLLVQAQVRLGRPPNSPSIPTPIDV